MSNNDLKSLMEFLKDMGGVATLTSKSIGELVQERPEYEDALSPLGAELEKLEGVIMRAVDRLKDPSVKA